jgi:hypothetical protein
MLELDDMLALHLQAAQRTQASSRDPNETARIVLTLTLLQVQITKGNLQVSKGEIPLFALWFVFLEQSRSLLQNHQDSRLGASSLTDQALRSPKGAAQGVATTPPIVARSKDNSNPFTQDVGRL